MKQSLNGTWNLFCHKETGGHNPPFGVLPQKSEALFSAPAAVPGEVQTDLFAAGIEPDPFFGDNYYRYIKYEACGWVYEKAFIYTPESGNDVFLRFGGIDTVADIFLNGVFLGHTENMLTEQVFSVKEFLVPGENTLAVHVFSAVNFIRHKPYPVSVQGDGDRMQLPYLRKAAHSVGWDIFPRMMTAGLWRDVELCSLPPTRITETYFAVSNVGDRGARLRWAVRFASDLDDLEDFELRIEGACRDRHFGFTVKPAFTAANGSHNVTDPYLWWPSGYGEPNLYTVNVRLFYKGALMDEKTERIGLRSVKLERDFTPGQQKFQFYVNNVPVFLRGSNHVPTDVFHARAKDRAAQTADLYQELGCNVIRSWGGGIYEDDVFYDKCDENGIFIWQDFAFGNALYPQDGSMDENVAAEAEKLIKRIRSHPSVLVYAADNEIGMVYSHMEYPDADKICNRIAEEVLRTAVSQHDPYRQLLQSSPEVPFGFTVDNVPEQHTWGARAWYKDDYYKHSSASFIGEAGYHGCPAEESLRRFIPEEDLWPPFNRSWAAHSTEDLRTNEGLGRIRLMTDQAELLCGHKAKDLDELVLVSQFAQAEAVKFFIERSLYLRPKRTGVIWWNAIDGWPQISDAVVDHYGRRKQAFEVIRRAQRPVTAFIGECSGWDYPFVIANCTLADANVAYEISDADTGETLLSGETAAPANRNTHVGSLRMPVSAKRLLLIRYTVNGEEQINHYITGFPPYDTDTLRRWREKLEFSAALK